MINEEILLILANNYKVSKTTVAMLEDIKQLKKINQIFNRIQQNQKDVYFLEIINILKYMQQQVTSLYDIIQVIYYVISLKYQKTVLEMIKLLEGD